MSGSMGYRCASTGLSHRICRKTQVPGGSYHSSPPEFRKEKNIITRGRRVISKISYTRGDRKFSRRVLLDDIFSSKEKQHLAADYKSSSIKPIYQEVEIQDDHVETSNSRSEDRRLDAVDRFKGCILPCPGLSRTLEVPQISCGKSNVRIQSIALRDNISAEGVYKDDGSGDREYQKNDRTLQLCVPRRLLGEGPGQVVFGIKISGDDRVHDQDRANYKLGEVRTRANTRLNVYRGQIFDQDRHRDDSGRSSRGNHDDSGENKESKKSGCQTVSEVPRTPEQLHISGRMGKTTHQAITAVSSGMVEAQQREYRRHDSNFTISDRTHSLVGAGEQFAERSVVRSTGSATDLGIGCEQDRLGSLFRVRRRSQREMVRDREGETYQLAGDEGNFQCVNIFPGHGEGTSDQSEMRQHNSGSLYKQAGRNPLVKSMLSGMGDAKLVPAASNSVDGGVYTGEDECASRPVLTPRSTARVVAVSGCSEGNFPDMGNTVHGSVCEFAHKETASLLFQGKGSGSIRDGQSIDQLEGPGGVCLPPRALDSSGPVEGQEGRLQNNSDCVELGKEVLDVSVGRLIDRRSKEIAHKGEASKTSRSTEIPSKPRTPKLICMEGKRSELRKRGFRKKSAELATSDIRATTCKTYGYKIQKYIDWCDKERIKHPRSTSVADVCNFLTEMFEGGVSAHAVSGYISALSKWHRKIHGKYLCEMEELKNIRKATAIQRPPRRVEFKTWNLSLVLQSLTREPFEPMVSAQMKYVSYKAVFLVAAATARRCSELGALSIAQEDFIQRPQHIEIRYIPNFIPKNARVNYAGRTVVIPSFKDMASCKEEELMCPVRALGHYLKRSALFRKEGEKRLFVTFGAGDSQGQGASNKTLARWIVDTIKHAYLNADEEDCQVLKMNAHSVRSVATTYAMLKGIGIQHILEAADWASSTTFINHYFKPGSGEGQAFAAAVLRAVSM